MTATINASTSAGVVVTSDTSGSLALQTNSGVTALTIDTSQNVGIGTSSPAYPLDVAGAIRSNSWIGRANTSAPTTDCAVYRPADNSLGFSTANTERMRIDSSGNVGIGTSSPSTKLQVQKNGKAVQLWDGSTNDGTYMVFAGSSTTKNWCIGNQFNVAGALEFTQTTANGGTTIGATPSMVIDSSGNLLVGTTSNAYTARINSAASTNNGTTAAMAWTNSSGSNLGTIFSHGVWSTGTYTYSPYNSTTGSAANMYVGSNGVLYRSTSSLKYKKDVVNYDKGLSNILTLRPVYYKDNRTDEYAVKGDQVYAGLIAEEVEQAGLTEFVQYAADGTPDALSYGNMVSLCIKSIQELSAQVTTLQTQVAQLQSKVGE